MKWSIAMRVRFDACGLLVGLTVTLAHAAPALANAPPDRRLVESSLVVEATSAGTLDAVGETRVEVPTDAPIENEILTLQDDDGRRHAAQMDFASGMDVVGRLAPWQPSELSRVEVKDGELSTWVRDADEVFPGADEETTQFHIVWSHGLRIRSGKPNRHVKVPWVVRLSISDASVQTLEPPPTRLEEQPSHSTVVWRFPPGKARAIRVSLGLPWAARLYAAVGDSKWWGSWGLALVVSGVLFLPVLFFLVRGGAVAGADEEVSLFSHQLGWLLAAASLAVATAATEVLREAVEFSSWTPALRVAIKALPSLLAIWCIAAIYLTSQPTGRRRRVFLVAGLVNLAFLGVEVSSDGGFGDFGDPVNVLLALAAVIGLGIALYGMGVGLLLPPMRWAGAWIESESIPGHWRRRATLAAYLLAVVSTSTVVGVVAVDYHEAVEWATTEVLFVADNLAFSASSLLPLILVPAVVYLLVRSPSSTSFLPERSPQRTVLFVLYLFFVVPITGSFVGFRVPMALPVAALGLVLLSRVRWVKLDQVEEEVAGLNEHLKTCGGESLLVRFRRELVDRTFVIQGLRRLRLSEHQGSQQEPVREPGQVASSRDKVQELGEAEAFFQTGKGGDVDRSDEARKMVHLRFPPKPPVIYPSLGCGPGRNWQENGEIALRLGSFVAAGPIAYAICAFFANDLKTVLESRLDLAVLFMAGIILSEVATWLVAAFVFGCLFSWLPWSNGPLKGMLLAAPAIAGVGVCSLAPAIELQQSWLLYSFKLVLVLSLTGLLMDMETMKRVGLRSRDVFELYQVRSLRFGLVSLLPIALSLIGIYFQIKGGVSHSGLAHAINSSPGDGGESR